MRIKITPVPGLAFSNITIIADDSESDGAGRVVDQINLDDGEEMEIDIEQWATTYEEVHVESVTIVGR